MRNRTKCENNHISKPFSQKVAAENQPEQFHLHWQLQAALSQMHSLGRSDMWEFLYRVKVNIEVTVMQGKSWKMCDIILNEDSWQQSH